MRGYSSNPFSVTPALAMTNPAESYMQGMNVKASREALESQREQQQRQSEFMAEWQTTGGDPVAQLQLMRRYPEMAKMVRDQYEFGNELSAQWQIDDSKALLNANTPEKYISILQDKIKRLQSAGIPADESMRMLRRAQGGATMEELRAMAAGELMGSDEGRAYLEAREKQGQYAGDTELGKMYNLRNRVESGGGKYKDQRLSEIDRKIEQMVSQDTSMSAGSREFQSLIAGLPDDQQAQATLIKLGLAPRAVGKANHVVNVGGVPHMVTYDAQGKPSMSPITLSTGEDVTAESVGDNKGTIASKVAEDTEVGRDRGMRIVAAPQVIESGNNTLSIIRKAINHPGRAAATGASSVGNRAPVPGSDRFDFLVLADQMKGKNFLEAYQSLKGGGTITEIEGGKAEAAQARLNEAQSEGEYLVALQEMESLINERIRKAELLLSRQNPAASTPNKVGRFEVVAP